jgi:hypothetical protein
MRNLCLGTLIRHAARELAATIGTLAITMIQPSLGALLMTPVRGAMLPAPGLAAALRAAIALAAIAAGANPEQISTVNVAAKPKPENNFPMNRHPRAQTPFDNGNGSCQGKTNSRLPSFWHEGYL